MNDDKENNELLTEVDARLADWEKKSISWYLMYYSLGLLATVLVITAASKPSFMSEDVLGVVIWFAAVTQGVSTFLISLQKASSYRSAWRTLKFAQIDFKASSNPNADKLKDAIKSGWLQIDKGYSDSEK